jgi:ParB family chromosome partitioning protein
MATLSLVKNPDKQSLDNSGTKHVATMVKLDSISTAEPFKTLFAINPVVIDKIVDDIMANGFDASQPLHIWKEKGILIDGHTRLEAAKRADLFQVPVYEHSFDSEASALEYAIHMQRDRRNLSDAELYACILELDKRGTHGGARFKGPSGPLGSSKQKTAAIVGTSTNKIQKVRTISDHAPADVKDELKKGKLSINQAYTRTQQARNPRTILPSGSTTLPSSTVDASSPYPSFSIADELASKNRIVITFDSSLSDGPSIKIITVLNTAIEKALAQRSSKNKAPKSLDPVAARRSF